MLVIEPAPDGTSKRVSPAYEADPMAKVTVAEDAGTGGTGACGGSGGGGGGGGGFTQLGSEWVGELARVHTKVAVLMFGAQGVVRGSLKTTWHSPASERGRGAQRSQRP